MEVIRLDEFGGYALPGHPREWNRYSFAWARVRLGHVLDAWGTDLALLT